MYGTRIRLWVSTFTTALLASIGLLLALGGFALSLTAMTEMHTTLPALLSAKAHGVGGERYGRSVVVTHIPHWLHGGGRCWGKARAVRERQLSITAGGVSCPSLAASQRSQQPAGITYPFRPDLREDLMQMTIAQRWYRQVRSPDRPNSGPR